MTLADKIFMRNSAVFRAFEHFTQRKGLLTIWKWYTWLKNLRPNVPTGKDFFVNLFNSPKDHISAEKNEEMTGRFALGYLKQSFYRRVKQSFALWSCESIVPFFVFPLG